MGPIKTHIFELSQRIPAEKARDFGMYPRNLVKDQRA